MKKLLILVFLLVAVNLHAQISLQYVGKCRQKALIFEGNSLSCNIMGGGADFGFYIPITVYNNVRATPYILAFTSYAVGGRRQSAINAAITTNITPYVKKGDVIVLWEGTNAIGSEGLTGAQAFAQVLTYAQTVKAYGCKIMICTCIAIGLHGSTVSTEVINYNNLIRANASSFDVVCDIAANSIFDTESDAANATYYTSDQVHLIKAGQDIVIGIMTPSLLTIL